MATSLPSADPSREVADDATGSTTHESRDAKADETSAVSSDAASPAEATTPQVLSGDWTVGRGAELLALAKAWIAGEKDVTLDCSSLERLDVAAMQVLLAAKRKSTSNGLVFRLEHVPSGVVETIRLTGLQELFS